MNVYRAIVLLKKKITQVPPLFSRVDNRGPELPNSGLALDPFMSGHYT